MYEGEAGFLAFLAQIATDRPSFGAHREPGPLSARQPIAGMWRRGRRLQHSDKCGQPRIVGCLDLRMGSL